MKIPKMASVLGTAGSKWPVVKGLRAYGFEENTVNLLRSYLSNRQNRIRMGSQTSSWQVINRGCPQGSALGPLLWNIFQNDLAYEIKSNLSMYADDHQIYEAGKDLANVKSSLSRNADKASKWYEDNMLKGNYNKYKTMTVQNKRDNKPDHERSRK